MKNMKLYFEKESMVEFVNNVAFAEGSTITLRELDEAACLIRISDRISLDKGNKTVKFKIVNRDKTLKIGDAYKVVERHAVYDAIRGAFVNQLMNRQFTEYYGIGYLGIDYDVEGDDMDIISVLEGLKLA